MILPIAIVADNPAIATNFPLLTTDSANPYLVLRILLVTRGGDRRSGARVTNRLTRNDFFCRAQVALSWCSGQHPCDIEEGLDMLGSRPSLHLYHLRR